MKDQVKELLSILIDGEASEIETHRLLKQLKQQGEADDRSSLIASWVSYQETRQVLRNHTSEQGVSRLSGDQHAELFQRISVAVGSDNESFAATPAVKQGSSLNSTMMKKPLAGMAMAASLVLAVFVGMQINQPTSSTSGQVDSLVVNGNNTSPVVADMVNVNSPAFSTTGEFAVANQKTATAADTGLRELDEEGQRRLRAYLNQHEQMSRIPTNSQLVNYTGSRP